MPSMLTFGARYIRYLQHKHYASPTQPEFAIANIWVFLHTSTTEGNCTNLTSYANCRYAPQPRLSGTARILCRRTSLTLKQLEQPESRRGVVQFWSTRVESPPPLHPHRYRICRLVYTPSVQSLYLTLASSDRVFP